ncbi:hypothetical protein BU16DRAFT_491596 [Lophium mytilinum]|uniref:N-acetyltransferase domain-containing protein n=1 Tax=Lophium mytilinum TaxID=390894 RepID=A0A6A6QJG4_9PEZI|nr:hypothetical protein BU16DRAFT_491596 [Lophium mytilinum]
MRPPTDEESDGGVSFKSDSNGDPNHDIRKLTDWDGNWLPAPIEWEGRRGFSDRNFSSRVEGWIVKTEKSYRNLEIIDTSAPRFLSQDNGDVAPRVWIPQTIDAESPGAFWRTYQSRAPPPMSDFDPDDLPWWEKYESPTSSLLKSIEVPNAFLDREDPTYAKAQQDNGAVGAIKRREHLLKAKHARTAAKRRHQLAESKAAAAMYADHPEPPDNSLHPKGNIFVRPAYPADMEQVRDIYNHYVMHTIQSPEYEPRTRTHMVNRITDITNNHLPYIVAIDRSHKGPNSGLRHLPERIVGFANADDYCHPGSMYRFTVEMELYVHPEYSHKGVGSCLLDKLLDLLDNGYRARGGYDWYAKPDYRSDGQRVVKTVNVQVPYDHNNTYVIEWIKAWLKAFGFKAAGDMYRMGYKNNTVINVAIFQFATSEFIDPRERPSNPL